MKKYIIIAGVPRAGKSTVSQMIAKRMGFQHISMDSIIAGIEKVFPETGVDTDALVEPQINLEFLSSKIAPFIRAMMDSGEYEECDYGVVIDVYQLLPKDYIEFIKNEKCEIYYFLSSDVTPEERYKILKLFDTPSDYTYYHSDEENKRDCIDIVDISIFLKEQCILYGLPYYETTKNRKNVLDKFMDYLDVEDQEQMIIRKATRADARQIAEIIVEDWKNAYRGIIDSDYLDSISVEERYQRELQRYQIYIVAAVENEILGFTWNEVADNKDSDCEIIALYVKYEKRKSGIGRALFQNSIDYFKASGKKKMIIWCLKENYEARRFYEKMGGEVYKTGTHKWGNRDYDMISYLYHLDES